MVQLEWRTGSLWLLDCSDEQAGREEQPLPGFEPQWSVSSLHGHNSVEFVYTFFTFAFTFPKLMTEAFTENICKTFSNFKLVTDNLVSIYAGAMISNKKVIGFAYHKLGMRYSNLPAVSVIYTLTSSLSFMLTSASLSTRISMMTFWPSLAAICRGVRWYSEMKQSQR